MYKNLDDYISEVSHYLVVTNGKDDILKEIESHILEKVEVRFGKITDDNIHCVIMEYGKPKDVAERYMENFQILAPLLRNYLILYTGIVFAIHLGLYLISLVLGYDIGIIPLVYIPNTNLLQIIMYLPMTLIFDFGLVTIFLMLVTQKSKDLKLPWFKGFKRKAKNKSYLKITAIIALIYIPVLYTYIKFGTVFAAISLTNGKYAILQSDDVKWYSTFIIVLFTFGMVSLIVNYFSNSELIHVAISIFELLLLWVLIKHPPNMALKAFSDITLRDNMLYGFKGLFIFATILVCYRLVKSIINFSVRQVSKL